MLASLCLLVAGGCTARDIGTEYGLQSGIEGGTSVNGTRTFAQMFRRAGHQVTTLRRLSPRLGQYDVVVWIPDDFHPPSVSQRVLLENWLGSGGKTLIYVGRDYDAAPHYWDAILPLVPVDERPEVLTRRAASRARHDQRRLNSPSDLFARWFHFRREVAPRYVHSLSSSAGWTEGIDAGRLGIRLETRLEPPVPGEEGPAPAASSATPPGLDRGLDEEIEFLDDVHAELQGRGPDYVEVLLAGDGEALVTQLGDASWQDSRILVVTNGSFLLNYGLLNREHRKLAGRVIEQCGSGQKVAFLETSDFDRRVYRNDGEQRQPTGLEAFTSWPLGFILMQAMLLGMVLCFVLFPIFGTPRQQESVGLTDFGKHVEALGKLLERTRNASYARELLREHQAGSRADSPERPPPPPDSD